MSDLQHLRDVARATNQYLIVWTSILVWDTFSTLRTEHRLIWKREWTLLKACYMLNRYGTFILEVASAVIILLPMSQDACRRIYWIQPVTIVFVIVICQSIMAIRIYAIYEREKRMGYLLIALVAIEAVGCMGAATQIVPLNLVPILAKTLELEGCLVVAKPGHQGKVVLVLAVFPFTFDTTMLALAAYRSISVHRKFKVKIPLLQTVVRDGILYYLGITATHVVTTVLWFQNDITVKSFNVPSSIVIPSIMCTRLILSLLSRAAISPTMKPLSLLTVPGEGSEQPKTSQIPVSPRSVTHHVNAVQTEGDQARSIQEDGRTSFDVFGRRTTPSHIPILPLPPSPVFHPPPSPRLSNPPLPRPPKSPLRPLLPTRPSLSSRKSEATLESIKSRRSERTSSSEPPILAVQVTQEVVVTVAAIEDPLPTKSRVSRSLSPSRADSLRSIPTTGSGSSLRGRQSMLL